LSFSYEDKYINIKLPILCVVSRWRWYW